MARPGLRALLVGVGTTLAAIILGVAAFVLIVAGLTARGDAGGLDALATSPRFGYGLLFLSPVLGPILIVSIGLGLWTSHRAYRRATGPSAD